MNCKPRKSHSFLSHSEFGLLNSESLYFSLRMPDNNVKSRAKKKNAGAVADSGVHEEP